MASRFVARLASVEKPCLIVPVTSCKLDMFQFLCTWSFNLRMETAVQEVPLLVCLETIQQLGSLHLSMYTCRQGCHCLRLTDGFWRRVPLQYSSGYWFVYGSLLLHAQRKIGLVQCLLQLSCLYFLLFLFHMYFLLFLSQISYQIGRVTCLILLGRSYTSQIVNKCPDYNLLVLWCQTITYMFCVNLFVKI